MVIHFTKDFDWCVGRVIYAYKAGTLVDVTSDCAETAIELGRAVFDGEVAYPEEADAFPGVNAGEDDNA